MFFVFSGMRFQVLCLGLVNMPAVRVVEGRKYRGDHYAKEYQDRQMCDQAYFHDPFPP
jgi:hypothetical protein